MAQYTQLMQSVWKHCSLQVRMAQASAVAQGGPAEWDREKHTGVCHKTCCSSTAKKGIDQEHNLLLLFSLYALIFSLYVLITVYAKASAAIILEVGRRLGSCQVPVPAFMALKIITYVTQTPKPLDVPLFHNCEWLSLTDIIPDDWAAGDADSSGVNCESQLRHLQASIMEGLAAGTSTVYQSGTRYSWLLISQHVILHARHCKNCKQGVGHCMGLSHHLRHAQCSISISINVRTINQSAHFWCHCSNQSHFWCHCSNQSHFWCHCSNQSHFWCHCSNQSHFWCHCSNQSHFWCHCSNQSHFWCHCSNQSHFWCHCSNQSHFWCHAIAQTSHISGAIAQTSHTSTQCLQPLSGCLGRLALHVSDVGTMVPSKDTIPLHRAGDKDPNAKVKKQSNTKQSQCGVNSSLDVFVLKSCKNM